MGYRAPIRRCYSCSKKLEEFEGKFLQGQHVYDRISGLPFHTGQVYCEKCFAEMTGENLNSKPTEKKKSSAEIEKETIQNDLAKARIKFKDTKYIDFIKSLETWFSKNGKLTEGQLKALIKFKNNNNF